MHTLLPVAESAARSAGTLLRSMMGFEQKVLSAQGRDIKLQADQDAEAVIIETLRRSALYPVLAEESGLRFAPEGRDSVAGDLPAGPVWIVDPLDGTFNYDRGLPLCCVSIALWEDGVPVLGVIYDFNHDEMFSGVVGHGAWLQTGGSRQEMHVSNVTELKHASLATGLPIARDFGDESLKRFIAQIQQFKKQRMIGTAALAMAYAACGRVDAYFEEGGRLWDIAAGVALIRAAGGVVNFRASPGSKKPWTYDVTAAGTPDLAAQVGV
jgi:myo-inositol-1(or 4)-monophosphatase